MPERPSSGCSTMRALLCGGVFCLALSQAAAAYTFLPPECKDGTKACIETGKLTYVSVYGPIRGQDLEVFEEIDYLMPDGAPFPIVMVNSPGGRQRPAIAIGRILRDRKAEVRSGSPLFPDRRPECSSACTYLAAGAVRRYLNHIGIHSGHYRQSTGCGEWKPVALDEADEKEVKDYLREMGIPEEYDKIRAKTPYDQMADFTLDRSKPVKSQKIAQIGFFQGDREDFGKLPEIAFDLAMPITEQREYRENAAILGLSDAIWDLIEYLNWPQSDDEQDRTRAFEWLKQLVARNDAYAHYVIGNYYADGFGTKKNEAEALRQYLLAAQGGIGQAQAIVGRSYLEGRGLPRDVLASVNWSLRAAERGEPMAYQNLCELFGQQSSGLPSKALGAMWCGLAVSTAGDVSLITKMEKWEDGLTRGMPGVDLERIQDLAVNWHPLQDKKAQECSVGVERF